MSEAPLARNVPSVNLTDEENELLFSLVGHMRQTKATAVVQMFHAQPDRSQWSKFKTGVVCFVKDNVKKSYYVRLFDLPSKSLVYEQEVYNQFIYKNDRPYFHSFAGDKFMIGLNFSDDKEAAKFNQAVESKLFEREKRATIRRSREENKYVPISKPPMNKVESRTDSFSGSSKKNRPKWLKGKISKADIGAPSDFRHLSHVGFDPSTGAFDSSNIAPEWKILLDSVGVTHEQLKNKDTASFIYDFVEKHGGIQEANRQLQTSIPTPNSRNQEVGRSCGLPPPRPNRERGAPPPPPPLGRPGPPRPPEPSRGGGSASLLPPPPPPPIGDPASLSSSRSGGRGPPPLPGQSGGEGSPLPSRDNKSPSSLGEERGDLLASIRAGMQLKKVSSEDAARVSPPDDVGITGMAGALARALAQRSNVIQHSDSEEDEEWLAEEDEDEWTD